MLQADDIDLRLPCTEQSYEDGTPSQSPLYRDAMDTSDPVAQTICIASLWQRVVEFTYRSSRRPFATYPQSYEAFYTDIQKEFSDWTGQLPPHLQYSYKALMDSLHNGHVGNFLAMHVLYHMSQLKAARMIYHQQLPAGVVMRSIRAANFHASQLLKVVRDVRLAKDQYSGTGASVADLMSPFIAFSITTAIDTLGAGGLREDLAVTNGALSSAVATLQDISTFCVSARSQAKRAEMRLAQMKAIQTHPNSYGTNGRDESDRSWSIAEPLEKYFPLAQDVVYGVPASTYIAALQES